MQIEQVAQRIKYIARAGLRQDRRRHRGIIPSNGTVCIDAKRDPIQVGREASLHDQAAIRRIKQRVVGLQQKVHLGHRQCNRDEGGAISGGCAADSCGSRQFARCREIDKRGAVETLKDTENAGQLGAGNAGAGTRIYQVRLGMAGLVGLLASAHVRGARPQGDQRGNLRLHLVAGQNLSQGFEQGLQARRQHRRFAQVAHHAGSVNIRQAGDICGSDKVSLHGPRRCEEVAEKRIAS